jgi:hypothetical protein
MKLKICIASIIFSVCIIPTSIHSSFNPQTSNRSASVHYDPGTITYERVFIDGLWWVIVLEDGVKIQQYVDPNQY